MKIGVTLVQFDESDWLNEVSKALKTSGSKGLLFSPGTMNDASNEKRANDLY